MNSDRIYSTNYSRKSLNSIFLKLIKINRENLRNSGNCILKQKKKKLILIFFLFFLARRNNLYKLFGSYIQKSLFLHVNQSYTIANKLLTKT